MGAPAAGTVVAWFRDDAAEFGVVAAEERQRIVVLTAGGKEERIAPSRIAASLETGPAPGRTAESRRDASERASAASRRAAKRAAEVDVPTLWELTRERAETIDEGTLASLAAGDDDPWARLATAIALAADGVRFVRKPSGWQPREEVAVRGLIAERERRARRESERSAASAALARAWKEGAWQPSGSETETKIVAALTSLAVLDLATPERERQLAADALAAADVVFDRPAEGAFRLLRKMGRFDSDDANLAIVRFGLRTEFSDEALRAAASAGERGFDRAGRRDLTQVAALAVDDPATREIDDALSVRETGGGVEIGIHIADPCAFVADGDPVDVEARTRGTTYYFPDRRLLMLPPVLSEDAASLLAGAERPALSFFIAIDPEGRIVDAEIVRSIVRVAARLDYDEVDAVLRTGAGAHAATLMSLAGVADRRERFRKAAGAIALRAPEAEVRVAPDGTLALARRDPDTPAQRLVSEAMILAGEVAAAWLDGRGVSAIYRRQTPPDGPIPERDPAQPAIVHVRSTRRLLKRGEAGLVPGPHAALGLRAYAQVTSPLRRYQDLALHRQIAAVLERGAPPYGPAAMQAILGATERAESDARRAERDADRYWMLRWLERSKGGTVLGVVVESSPRPVVVLDETLVEEPVPSIVGASRGDRVRLRVERVNPRADLLVLRPT
ncbi:MAG TPA: RNB domain-containing ribonuclease [Candidatus Polarisedimenticolaceae bacterium]|nr:RNB domain-containing ribonuclease [Candidatus Polarisedimenticolaceae bacterium]